MDTHGVIRLTSSGTARTLAQLPDQLREFQQVRRAERRPSRRRHHERIPGHHVRPLRLQARQLTSVIEEETRLDCQLLRRFTNSNDRPDSGWNRCVTRTRSRCSSAPASRVVDSGIEQRI